MFMFGHLTDWGIFQIDIWFGFNFFVREIRSVFDGLKSIFHLHAQSFNFFRSEFISFSRVFRFLNLLIRATSSANRNMSDFIFLSISLRYIKKKRDESIDPCGTEPNIFKNSDDFPFKTTLWDLPDKYDSIHFKSDPPIPILRNLNNSRL